MSASHVDDFAASFEWTVSECESDTYWAWFHLKYAPSLVRCPNCHERRLQLVANRLQTGHSNNRTHRPTTHFPAVFLFCANSGIFIFKLVFNKSARAVCVCAPCECVWHIRASDLLRFLFFDCSLFSRPFDCYRRNPSVLASKKKILFTRQCRVREVGVCVWIK